MTPGTRLLEALTAWIDAPDRFARDGLEADVIDAFGAVSTARALYPAAHAIGDRVSVVYPDERKPGYEDFTGTVVGVEFTDTGVDYRVLGDGDPDYTVVEAGFVHPEPEVKVSGGGVVDPERSRVATDIRERTRAQQSKHDPFTPEERTKLAMAEYAPRTKVTFVNRAGEPTEYDPAGPPKDLPPVDPSEMLWRPLPDGPAVRTIVRATSEPSPSWFPMDGRRVTEGSPGDRLTPGGSTTTLLIPGRVKVTTHMDEYGVKTTETVDLRDLTSPHGRMIEELSAELARNVGETKDFKAGMLAGLEYAVEVVEKIWPKEQK